MNNSISLYNIYGLSLLIFVISFSFAYAYNIFKSFEISSYLKCFSGGVILSTIIFHIMPHLYESEKSFIAELSSGISFLIILSIDKVFNISEEHSINLNTPKLEALVFVVALSMHSFLEGLGVSLKSGKKMRWYVFGLVGHKWIEAFTLGISVIRSSFSPFVQFILILIYSMLTPISIILGSFIHRNLSGNRKYISDVLNGVSAGSFFYIGFIEMINSEFAPGDSYSVNMQKMIVLFLGFLVIGGITYSCDKFMDA